MRTRTPFGAALRLFRKKKKNLTQPKLAKVIGISQAMISRIEVGLDEGSSETREKITNYFGIPYDDFLEAGRQQLFHYAVPPEDVPGIVAKEIERQLAKNSTPAPTNDLDNHKNQKNKLHHAEINKFVDQKTAFSINQKLVLIEKLDPDKLKEINEDIEVALNRLRSKTQGSEDPNLGNKMG